MRRRMRRDSTASIDGKDYGHRDYETGLFIAHHLGRRLKSVEFMEQVGTD